MIFWRIDRLLKQIRERPLSSRDVLPYAIATAILTALAFVTADWLRPWDRDEFEAAVDSVTTLLAGATSVVGVWACYRANGHAHGIEFIDRVLSVGFVLFVRFVVVSAVVFILWAYAAVFFNVRSRPSFEDLDLLFVFVVAFFWFRLRGHINSVAHARAAI